MKRISTLLFFFIVAIGTAQTSSFYAPYGSDNFSTLNYDQLDQTNVQMEKSRVGESKFQTFKDKAIALKIAKDPLKAYKYGYDIDVKIKGSNAAKIGFKKLKMSYRIPNGTLFKLIGQGRFKNIGLNGIVTMINIYLPQYNKDSLNIDIKKIAEFGYVKVGEINEGLGPDGESIFAYKQHLEPAVVFGIKGYKSTLCWENNYRYTITDNFLAFDKSQGNGVLYYVKVRTYGYIGSANFKQIEGRRYFLKDLIAKIVATAKVTKMRF